MTFKLRLMTNGLKGDFVKNKETNKDLEFETKEQADSVSKQFELIKANTSVRTEEHKKRNFFGFEKKNEEVKI